MKLCHVVPSLEEQHGGPSKSVRALCGALAEGEDPVDLYTTAHRASGQITEGRLGITTFRRGWPDRICPSRELHAALDQSDAEVVHHHALWLRTLHYAHRFARRTGATLIVSPRGMMGAWAWRHHRWRKQLSRILIHPGALAAVQGWHVTSAEEGREVRALGFSQPICVAPNGVEAPTASEIAEAAAHWRAACPAVMDQPVALFYSRFHSKKRVIELIDLWLEHGPRNWLLLLVGIPQEFTPMELEHYVLKMSAGGRVQVFSGIGRPPPYAVASLFLLPSHNENFGLVVAEAMAHGVPALVTDTTPWSEISRLDLGWCVSWSQFGAALRSATAEGRDRLQARGTRARGWVLREFSWGKSARQLVEFYRALRGNR